MCDWHDVKAEENSEIWYQQSNSICIRPPLQEFPSNIVRYPTSHHIPHQASVVSHTREWIPKSFAREPDTEKKAVNVLKSGVCGEHKCFLRSHNGGKVNTVIGRFAMPERSFVNSKLACASSNIPLLL